MSAPDNGGRAFPCPTPIINGNGDWIFTEDPGMSLRDWFAGQALAGMMADSSLRHGHDAFAEGAYQMADAMIAARLPKKDA